MKKFTMFATLAMVMVFALSSFASDELPKFSKGNTMIYGGSANLAKAAGDTVDLMGPAGSFLGDFEAGWNGWTSEDYTTSDVSHWNISNYNQADPLDFAMWCGDISIVSCGGTDPAGGYGNSWHDLVAYRVAVTNNAIDATVTVTADLQYDTEPGYDYTTLGQKIEGNFGFTEVGSWDYVGTEAVNIAFNYLPAEYIDGTDIYVVWQVKSDGGWSDGDCSWPTAGACQVDDVTVTVSQIGETDLVAFDDYQVDFGNWFTIFPTAVGDFAALWSGLEDADACNTNYTQQVAFIDDGVVVPGTGGSDCLDWCYGPAGYITSPTGGLAGPSSGLNNAVHSPVMPWPNAAYDGITFSFEVYRHENLTADSPGTFYYWGIRSADTDDSAGNGAQLLADQTFQSRNFIYYGGPDYLRVTNQVTDLMNPGRDEIQLELAALDHSAFLGNNGAPAPYFDNVAVKIFPFVGPGLATRELDVANDNFPEIGTINLGTLSENSVRFDSANTNSFIAEAFNGIGDSIVIDVVPVRTGAVLFGTPTLVWTMSQNPLFGAGERTSVYGMATSGIALGDNAVSRNASLDPDAWAFDLPDTGFLYPGDILHYYITADDDVGGVVQNTTMPGDLTGYGDFSGPLAYNSTFTVRALPSLRPDGSGGFTQPRVLLWNDNGNRGGEDEWYGAMDNLAMVPGIDYDIYHTNAPSSGVGNGLGGRASALTLAGYEDMLYTAGALGTFTISNGDFSQDPSNDIQVLLAWLAMGNRDMLLTGDSFISDLGINAGGDGLSFMETVLGLNIAAKDIRSLIGNQATPLVLDVTGLAPADDVFQTINTWIAYGGCFGINVFDAVTPRVGAVRQAEFADPSGARAYPYAAASLNYYNTTNRIVTMPYDFMFVYTDPSAAKSPAPLAARVSVLDDVLAYFGLASPGITTGVIPGAEKFAIDNFPNPFNPATTFKYNMPKTGHLSLSVFDVRGALVKTLINGQIQATENGSIVWNGTNNQGSKVSSGVYFYEARTGGDVVVNKMALVK